jgi:2-phosphosulfolactate phosphatase
VSTANEAFQLREKSPNLLLIGEINGYPIDGFDLPNSPTAIENLDLSNQRLALRTTAGTQGVVLTAHATHLYVASLCVATATAESIKSLNPETVTFVETGVKPKGGGEEDTACSDYIASILEGVPLSIPSIQKRVRDSRAATKFSELQDGVFPETDLEHSLNVDRFPFAMKVTRTDNGLALIMVHD